MRPLIFFFCLLLTSCIKPERIIYEYRGVVITRIDKDGETLFYYGKCDKNCPDSYIKVKYSGFNSGLSGLLIFHENRSVELVSLGGGYFDTSENVDQRLFMKEHKNYDLTGWLDSIRGKYRNISEITEIKLEKEINLKNHSRVKVSYPPVCSVRVRNR